MARVGYGPATGPTLKTAMFHIFPVVGRMINTEASVATLAFKLRWSFKIFFVTLYFHTINLLYLFFVLSRIYTD